MIPRGGLAYCSFYRDEIQGVIVMLSAICYLTVGVE